MLRDVNNIYGITVAASDGLIGEVRDCYFDDQTWTIRFFVVETGAWLGGRRVMISPIALHNLDWAGKTITASLTLDQVKRSPDVDTTMPVSRRHQVEQPGPIDAQIQLYRARGDDLHLRSCRAVGRYHIHATDSGIGHVDSFLLDDHLWSVRYLVVNTSNWWLGHQMLVAPTWIADISELDATVSVYLTRQAVKDAPTYVRLVNSFVLLKQRSTVRVHCVSCSASNNVFFFTFIIQFFLSRPRRSFLL